MVQDKSLPLKSPSSIDDAPNHPTDSLSLPDCTFQNDPKSQTQSLTETNFHYSRISQALTLYTITHSPSWNRQADPDLRRHTRRGLGAARVTRQNERFQRAAAGATHVIGFRNGLEYVRRPFDATGRFVFLGMPWMSVGLELLLS